MSPSNFYAIPKVLTSKSDFKSFILEPLFVKVTFQHEMISSFIGAFDCEFIGSKLDINFLYLRILFTNKAISIKPFTLILLLKRRSGEWILAFAERTILLGFRSQNMDPFSWIFTSRGIRNIEKSNYLLWRRRYYDFLQWFSS